ncbi:phospho-N-acetylmuramoyl-pentapeptide-transferase [Candidatus Azambacteria bacterium RIFOXYD1_FULL_42_11]|uniref:Phospho-N-acetylmuramoyl-pentapeptide-transferase n=2 Tax=Candidatus Azamiibacteriota TaxID=1752741 RepID=A0A0G1CAJ6_9BACT|nr:MAG: Phospho-N-acetylmuramoyl-pentapeptide-transferase [Candidatus Azambacteria bacterium GW2011_GWA1_42_19]KKS88939.1 MAG: Phospho-N-acetylmuramoyl-pentapeptide-transferase [Parcubacteria group bacterium GW2011_GWC1_43_11]OGD41788.1 MAG: phospho-N-acetylmuramoyl-pentapeptide-transferase [Candidatus Azambacteria bacterium RIFOXYD1_FULL_42_11]
MSEVARLLILTSISFIVAFSATPLLTHFLFKYRLGKQIRAEGAPIFAKIHGVKEGTPTMGGILIWGTTLILAVAFWLLSLFFDGVFSQLNFLSRSQTFLPLGALVFSAILGFADDLLGVFKIGPKSGGLSVKQKILLYTIVAAIGAYWFYFKLGWDIFYIPFLGSFSVGLWYIPIFIFIIVSTAFSTNETDGLDGLAGGVLLFAFAALGALAFTQGHYDLTAFTSVIVGALLAFLWFNIYPARFFMGDTGAMSLGVTLGIVAMLTNSALLLPLIAFILVFESGSVIVQTLSKKFRGKKIFLSTPIHHHFEALGWPETKVTMRFWIISAVSATIGLIIGLLGK